MQKISGWSEAGNTTLTITGAAGTITRKVQGSFPSSTVTVYEAGTVTLAPIYSDNALTSKANPFTAAADGTWFFYAANGQYDVKFSGGGLSVPFTIGAVGALDENVIWIDVTASPYFAKGDGTTDDAAAIQAAINAVPAHGATVYLPPGTYKISTYLTLGSNTIFRGCGVGSQITCVGDLPAIPALSLGATALVYVAASSDSTTISDLYVKGPYSGTGTSGTTFGIYVGTTTTNCQVLNNKVTNASWSGIHLFTGTGHLVEGNHTEHNAIDGIENWSTYSRIVNNYSIDDAAASANGVASIELINGCDGCIVANNTSVNSNNHGIQTDTGATKDVIISGNVIRHPTLKGIFGFASWTDFTIVNNTVDSPQGSGALGHGIQITDANRFRVINNTVLNANVGSGPSGIGIQGACYDVIVLGNLLYACWVGIEVAGTSGTSGTVLVTSNHTVSSTGSEYANTSSGTHIVTYLNAFGITNFTGNIPGTTTNDNAATGAVGEYIASVIGVGSAVPITTDTTANVTSVSLTAGDWDVIASANWVFAPSTSYTILQQSISTTTITIGPRDSVTIFETPAVVPSHTTDPCFVTPLVRLSLSSTTTVYFTVRATFSVSTLSCYGTIRARRVR